MRESHRVELVDDHGAGLGWSTVDEAHRAPGRLHRAFSVLLIDGTGRLLLQRRAAVKTRFALRWANACCGHPAPGETVAEAARRRLAEELGITDTPLTEVGVYVYRAEDTAAGRVEHEYDHVLVGRLADEARVSPDPAEVAELARMHPDDLAAAVAADPAAYAPWLIGVVDAWRTSLVR